jgi:hypothetical protein
MTIPACLLLRSLLGAKRTWVGALHMSAFGGKGDITIAACPLLRSLLGIKRTCLIAAQMSALDPKRTSAGLYVRPSGVLN